MSEPAAPAASAPMAPADVAALQAVVSELARRAAEPFAKYNPHPKQLEFHAQGATIRERLCRAANQAGKTTAGAMELAYHATGLYPDWWKGYRMPFDRRGQNILWASSVTGEATRDNVQRALFGAPGERIRAEKSPDLSQYGIASDPEGPGSIMAPDGLTTGCIPSHCILKMQTARGVADLLDYAVITHHDSAGTPDGVCLVRLKYYEQGREKWQGPPVRCVAEGQRVLMADGRYTPIEQVQVGDLVLTVAKSNGKRVARRVTAVHPQGERLVYDVRTRHGPWFQVTDDHDIYTSLRDKAPAAMADRAFEITSSWEPEPLVSLPDGFYVWLGLFISEGCYNQRKITLGLEDVVEAAREFLPPGARVRRKDFSNGHVPDWFIHWPDFWAMVHPGLSHQKQIPDWLFMSSNTQIALFLRFLYAGDGWASGHGVGYTSTSRVLIEQVMVLLWRLGVRSSMAHKPASGAWREQWSALVTQSDAVAVFCEAVGIEGKGDAVRLVASEATRRIASKKHRASHLRREGTTDERREYYRQSNARARDAFAPIDGLTLVGRKRVYDLTVEVDHSFCVGTAVVSNCVWYDEEPPADIYGEGLARLTATRGISYLTFTPLKGMSDVVRRFTGEASPDRGETVMTLDDALHIPRDEIERITAGYAPHEREARTRGIPSLGSGAVFPLNFGDVTYDPALVRIPADDPTGTFTYLGGIDFGWDHPSAAVRVAYDREHDVIYVTDEYRMSQASVPVQVVALRPWGSLLPWAWPHDGLQHDKGSGVQLAEQYRNLGLNMLWERATFADGSNGVEAGVSQMLERMMTGRMRINRNLDRLLDELRTYHRIDGRLVKIHDDLVSALRMTLMMLRFAGRAGDSSMGAPGSARGASFGGDWAQPVNF